MVQGVAIEKDISLFSKLDLVCRAVYKVIAYFDVFNHPISLNEIHFHLGVSINKNELPRVLELLIKTEFVKEQGGYYMLHNADSKMTFKRKELELNAKKSYAKAIKNARLIYSFPFVRSVAISGSLSKGVLERNGDVDYFIITEPGRLWVCRSLLVLYKKLILLNSKKYFCVNYFISTNNMEIPDKNLFVSVEIAHLKPIVGLAIFNDFLTKNAWVNDFLPHYEFKALDPDKPKYSSFEKWFNGGLGERLDALFFRWTLKRWKRKFSHFKVDDFDLQMRSRRNVSKHHPSGFQNKVLEKLGERMDFYDTKTGLNL